ncbi:Ca2+-transporting ATPase [Caldanaerobius fijiensis DSM 17918]|uniref:P-type Ca(2+) transporter n=1 Tax=Caldanaerobius fijiensis DSM 17918 TaxID=1121256 RepID=A0A1M5ABT7_9THEO|nr:calcium-transporting P-type ATPase, PMR1-type [Caldanaerobius fijiensis]SHF27362.1 Ca2+-transporting ATPase [Caldanaerobius fijiensis DSM 17918]
MIKEDELFLFNEKIKLSGLSQKEAQSRLEKYGFNELTKKSGISPLTIFLNQFKNFIIIVLLLATLISYFLGEVADAATITIIIIMNAILGFIQEYRTERSLEALKELSAPHATAIRDGKQIIIPARELVPGDIVILEAGDSVPADCALIEAYNVQVNESILTGESTPVEKKSAGYRSDSLKSAHKDNMLFMGTTITAGRAKAVVVSTGMRTEMGSIADMMRNTNFEATPLQKRLDRIGKELVLISIGVCILIIFAGIYHGESSYNMFFAGVSLAVAAIPEGLPAIVTVSLAIGVQRMLKRNALIRKLSAVETLGSTNVICSDKTGTITENKMTVTKIYVDDKIVDVTGTGYDVEGEFKLEGGTITPENNIPLQMLLTIGALCNNAEFSTSRVYGDPTEIAIMIASKKGHIEKKLSQYQRIAEIPFDSDRKCMSVICKDKNNQLYVFTKGAPDRVLDMCSKKLNNTGISLLTTAEKKHILSANEQMAGQALRILGFAYKKLEFLPREIKNINIEKNLIFVGLEGMIDPPRPETIESIKNCYSAGIKPVMITGDHKITAIAIAKKIGLDIDESNVLTGDEIETLSDAQLEKKVPNISVFARVTPKHKFRIVKAFKKHNNIVAMTGDGVNDAPALKEADIGIAMGKSGTDVAKEASSMILLDDNFATIVAAVEEGRIIYDNIRKFIRYLLSCNFGEILTMAVATFLGQPVPLIPIQILWINLVTDGLPALALGIDPPDGNIMERPPRKSKEGIFSGGLGIQILLSGLLIGASSLAAFTVMMFLSNGDLVKSRTVAFVTMIISELIYSFESRSEHKSIFETGFFTNPYLILATLSSFILTLIVIYIPFLSAIFKTVPLDFISWLIVSGFSLVEFIVNSLLT